MEYIDILDEKGNKTGEVKSKDEVHEKGLWHRAVHVWVVNSNGHILLQKRANKRSNPYMWDISAAGHISAGDNSIDSAQREVFEEIGIDLSRDDFKFIGEVTQQAILNNGSYINNEYNDVYLVKKDFEISDFKFNDGEVEKVEYVSKDQFKKWVEEGKKDLVSHPEEYELLLKNL